MKNCGLFSRKDDDSNEHNDNHDLMIDSGCCGHVCPQRFAPPFRVTSTSNIMAVAANHVALQHCGLKVVCGPKQQQGQTSFDAHHVRT